MGILRKILLGRASGHQGRKERRDPMFYCRMCGFMLIPFRPRKRICTNCGLIETIR